MLSVFVSNYCPNQEGKRWVASLVEVGTDLSQQMRLENLGPMVSLTKRLSPTIRNCSTLDLELLSIKLALKE